MLSGDALYGINPDGSERWHWTAIVAPASVGPDGTIYACSQKTVCAFNPDGTQKWTRFIGGTASSSPAIAADGTLYVAGNVSSPYDPKLTKIWALRPDGSVKWSYRVGALVDGGLAIGGDGTVYFGARDGNLRALNSNGTQKWACATPGMQPHGSPSLDGSGTVYIGGVNWANYTARLYAIRQALGGITIRSSRFSVSPGQQAVLSGLLDDAATVGQVMHVDVKKPGKTYWTYSSNRRIYSSGARAAWLYKYTFIRGMTRGVYRFRAVYGRLYSSTVGVTLR